MTSRRILPPIIMILVFAFVATFSVVFFSSNKSALGEEITEFSATSDHEHGSPLTENGGTLSSGDYYLDKDINLKQNLTISGTVNLCLNGYTLKGTGSSSVITINEGATLNLYDEGNGIITGGNTAYSGNGGGVYVLKSTFNMYGGIISGNKAGYGGGVNVAGKTAVFNMYGGEIVNNTANFSGAGVIMNASTFDLYGGKIANNTANGSEKNGGGDGGGVYLYNPNSKFTMHNGEIEGNTALLGGGGGVNVGLSGVFTMLGGRISQNSSKNNGGGVRFDGGGFSIGGNINISDNQLLNGTQSNTYLVKKKIIKVVSLLKKESTIGVTLGSGYTGAFTSGLFENGNENNFVPDDDTYFVGLKDGEAILLQEHIHNGFEFDKLISSTSGVLTTGNYYLYEDVMLDGYITISGTVNICLNGHKLLGNVGAVIRLERGSTLNLFDPEENGVVMLSENGKGSVISIKSGATFNMYGGLLTGGNVTGSGGGVYIDLNSTFNMYGGKISGNTATGTGGGVYVNYGEFNMFGGLISENKAGNYGGGVYVSGTFNMTGGEISENTASNTYNTSCGGGVYVNGNFNVSGEVNITGNTISNGSVESNVYLPSDEYVINISDELSANSRIGVSVANDYGDAPFTSGFSNFASIDNFSSDSNYCSLEMKEGELGLKKEHIHFIKFVAQLNATCTESGFESYYICEADGCYGPYFTDYEGSEIADAPQTIYASGHLWSYDAVGDTLHVSCLNENHNASVDGSQTHSLTLAWERESGLAFTGEVFRAITNGTLPEGANILSIAYEYSQDEVSYVPTEYALNAGFYRATVCVRADDNDYSISADFVIAKADINPSVSISGWKFGESAREPEVQGNVDNGVVSYSYTGKINNGKIYESNEAPSFAGNYTLTITIGETLNYNGATCSVSFMIARAVVNAPEVNSTKFVYNGVEQIYELATSDYYTISNNVRTNAGSQDVVISLNDKDNFTWVNGTTNDLTYTFTIARAKAVITASDLTVTYDGNAHSISATLNHNETELVYENNSLTNAGSVEVTITAEQTTNYERATLTVTLTVEKAVVNAPEVNSTKFVYNGVEQIYELATSVYYTITNNMRTNAGSQDVVVSLNDKDNFTWFDGRTNDLTYTFTIARAESIITASDLTVTYDGNAHSISATLNHNETELVYENNSLTNAGSVEVIITATQTTNYEGASLTVTLTVEKATVVAPEVNNTKFVYNGVEQIYDLATSDYYTISNNVRTNAGSQDVVVSLNDKDNFTWSDGTIANKTYTFTIARAEAVITASDLTVTYDGYAHSISATLNHNETELVYENNSLTNAGSVEVIITARQTTNYEGASLTVTLTVERAVVNAPDINSTKFVYNGSEQTYELATSDYYTITNNVRTNAGSQDVVVSLNDKDNFTWFDGRTNDLTYTFTIARAESIITASDLTVTYDGNAHSILATLNHNETELVYENNSLTNAGSVEVIITATQTTNYEGTTLTVTLTVEKAVVTAPEINNTKFVYNGSEQTYDLATSDYYTISNNVRINAGSQDVVVSLNDKDNFTWSDGTIANKTYTFTIARAEAIITASDLTATYDGNAHSISATLNHNETELVYENNSLTNAGSVEVIITATQTTNYEGASLTVTLTVDKATVIAPEVNNTKFVYNGSEQIYELATSDYYTITNNVRTNAGSQDVVVSLNDKDNFTWADGTTADKTYTFMITRATYDMTGVTFEDIEVKFGEDYEIIVKGTLPEGVSVTYSKKESAVGTYDIIAHFVGDYENYEEIQDMHATLTILEKETSGGDEPTDPQEPDVQEPNDNNPEKGKNSNAVKIALGVVIPIVVLAIALIVVLMMLKKKDKNS